MERVNAKARKMPDLPRQGPVFGGELEVTIAHQETPARTSDGFDAPSESIGEYLRQNRLRLGKTLTDISRASKILSHHLIAIENDAFEVLPGRAYVIGFVRSYAACLGLDAGPLVARLKAELAPPDMDPSFAAPNPAGRTDQTDTPPVDDGNADVLPAKAGPGLRLGRLAGAAHRVLQLQKSRAVLRFKEITKYTSELNFGPSSSAHRKVQVVAEPVESADGTEPKFDLFSATAHKDRTRSAFIDDSNATTRDLALVSTPTPRRRAPLFSACKRGLPLPSPPDHSLRNWLTVGLMGAAVTYFGFSILHSGLSAPPPVTAVPARLATEAALSPEKVAPPAIVMPEQPAPSALEPAPAGVPATKDKSSEAAAIEKKVLPPAVRIPEQPAQSAPQAAAPAPPAKDAPHEMVAIEKPATTSREPAYDPPSDATPTPSEATPTLPDATALEAKHAFRGQLPLGERYGEQNRGSRVTLRVHRPTFIAVLGLRNHQYINRVLRAGDTYRVPNMRGLKLDAHDAGAVEVILDGNTVGFAGEDGAAVKGMSLQPQNIVSHFHWLQG